MLQFYRSWESLSHEQMRQADALARKVRNPAMLLEIDYGYGVGRDGVVRERFPLDVLRDADTLILRADVSISVDDAGFPRVAYIGQEYDQWALEVEQREGEAPTISSGNAPLGQMTRGSAAFYAEAFRVSAWIAGRWEES